MGTAQGRFVRRLMLLAVAAAVVAAIGLAFIPEPLPEELVTAHRGPMLVTVYEEGRTRIRERYVVSSPLAGRVRRITLDPGDRVTAEESVLAIIEPTDPQFLDARARAEAEARVRAAEAAVQRSGADREQARANLDFAENELARIRDAYERGALSPHELEQAQLELRTAEEAFRAQQFAGEIARYELELAQAALLHTRDAGASRNEQLEIRSPITGEVLRVFQESVAVISPGTALMEVGDRGDLELVVDVLSTDAVRIAPGQRVIIEHWGGDAELEAVVRLVEPAAFTKVSSLGIEEQRVNVVADFVTPPARRPTLGDGYRVEARIVTAEADGVLQVPASSVFRDGDGWSVFTVVDGRARRQPVTIGLRNDRSVEVREGLTDGTVVVSHPSDALADGRRVEAR